MNKNTSTEYPTWNSRLTYILATTGAAVGLGNIWKFPYIAGENGGGAFVLMYLFCILLFGLPIMMAEVLLGRKGRANPIHAILSVTREVNSSKFWSLIGIMGVTAGIMILMYYSVVAGWSLEYVYQSATSQYISLPAEEVAAGFSKLSTDSSRQLLWHTIFILITTFIVGLGVTRGIGNAVNILMPILFLLLLLVLWYSFKNGEFQKGLEFMFAPDFSKLTGQSVLIAMGHAFFTLSLGMGTVMVYGSYMPSGQSISLASLSVASLDTLIALVAGMAIFPLVFMSGLEPGSGPGLLFETLPIAFSSMWGGNFFGTGFFLLVAIAALSSSISLIEPGIAWLEKVGVPRSLSAIVLTLLCWCGGVASIYSGSIFNTLDFLTANIMLPLGGLLISLFVGWKLGYTRVRKQISELPTLLFNIWFIILRFIAPAGVLVIFYQSIKASLGN